MGPPGNQYKHWKGLFYPERLLVGRWFEHYEKWFDTVEINNSFYHLLAESAFENWRERAADGFLYALKFSRYATHMKKLKDPKEPLDRFTTRAQYLADYLGPILVQLPPHWKVNVERLDTFLRETPGAMRWAVEFRDPSWLREEVYSVLRNHRAALCVHDLPPNHPWEMTAEWTYIRFHGGPRYDSGYSPEQLSSAARRIRSILANGQDAYVYFNNDVGGHAFRNAMELRAILSHSETARAD